MIDPVLVELPESIETDRLFMRPPRAGDGLAVFEAVTDSLVELRRFLVSLPWVVTEQSADVSERYCRTAQADFIARKDLPFLLFEKTTGRLIGASGLHRIEWATPKVEVGYWCRTSMSGRGLISEAVSALATYAFTHLRAARIELITDEENQASRRVADRCRFQLEGILRHDRRAADGSLRSTCVYARLPPPPQPAP